MSIDIMSGSPAGLAALTGRWSAIGDPVATLRVRSLGVVMVTATVPLRETLADLTSGVTEVALAATAVADPAAFVSGNAKRVRGPDFLDSESRRHHEPVPSGAADLEGSS